MPAEIYQTTTVAKVPAAAVIDADNVLSDPTVGQLAGDPWPHVHPGTRVDLAKWPADRTTVSKVRGKPPEKHVGAGAAAKDRMIARGVLVPEKVELPPDPAIQRTHPEKDIFREDGSVRTEEVKAAADDKPKAKTAKRKRGAK